MIGFGQINVVGGARTVYLQTMDTGEEGERMRAIWVADLNSPSACSAFSDVVNGSRAATALHKLERVRHNRMNDCEG